VLRRRLFMIASSILIALALAFGTAGASGPDGRMCLSDPFGPGCTAGLPSVEYQMLLDEMLLHPEPDVRPLAPNMPASQLAIARPSEFTGVYLDGELAYPMAWVLVPSYPSPSPGAAGDQTRPIIERYTRVNIFATTEVDGWEWYLVGPEAWISQTMVARVLMVARPPEVKGRWFTINLYEQVLVAYEEDTPVFATLVSSGLEDWPTNEGLYNVWSRQTNGHMSGAEGGADFYSLENVPWVMYYDEAISLHGTYWHDGFGYRHSHGCVNLTITDSYWAFNWSLDGGYEKPFVYVYSTGQYR
jgi:hypothetical protein